MYRVHTYHNIFVQVEIFVFEEGQTYIKRDKNRNKKKSQHVNILKSIDKNPFFLHYSVFGHDFEKKHLFFLLLDYFFISSVTFILSFLEGFQDV